MRAATLMIATGNPNYQQEIEDEYKTAQPINHGTLPAQLLDCANERAA